MVHKGLRKICKEAVFGPVEVLILASVWKELEKATKNPVRAKPVLQPIFEPSIFQILHQPAESYFIYKGTKPF
jgi:hypothetical protein